MDNDDIHLHHRQHTLVKGGDKVETTMDAVKSKKTEDR